MGGGQQEILYDTVEAKGDGAGKYYTKREETAKKGEGDTLPGETE